MVIIVSTSESEWLIRSNHITQVPCHTPLFWSLWLERYMTVCSMTVKHDETKSDLDTTSERLQSSSARRTSWNKKLHRQHYYESSYIYTGYIYTHCICTWNYSYLTMHTRCTRSLKKLPWLWEQAVQIANRHTIAFHDYAWSAGKAGSPFARALH